MHESFVMYITIVLVKQEDFYKKQPIWWLTFLLELRTSQEKKNKNQKLFYPRNSFHKQRR